jgi:hypothetical protein
MSKGAMLMRIEGVLSKETLVGPAQPSGVRMLALADSLDLTVYYVTDGSATKAVEWLETEAKQRGARVIPTDVEDPITMVRSLGYEVQFYIDSQPSRVAYAMDKGATGILFAEPAYMRPEFRPGWRGGVTEWGVLTGAMEEERATKADDDRQPDGPDQLFSG